MGLFANRRKPDGSYTPPRIHWWLKPEVSGNTINGVDETEVRRPTPIYHHAGKNLAYQRMQNSFYMKIARNPFYWPRFKEVQRLDRSKPTPIAETQKTASPQNWSNAIKTFALENGADVVGIAAMKNEWVFDGYEGPEKHPWIIMIGVKMNHAILQRMADKGVDTKAGTHVIDIYNHGNRTARRVANWLREQGWYAYGSCGPMAGPVTLIPPAIEAGLGELGKHGSTINRTLGANFRLAYLLTDVPLVADKPDIFGADEFCTNCNLCQVNCPPDAIYSTKQMIRGTEKWYVDFDKCVPYFNDSQGCGICLAVCPWSRPGLAERLVDKMTRRKARLTG